MAADWQIVVSNEALAQGAVIDALKEKDAAGQMTDKEKKRLMLQV